MTMCAWFHNFISFFLGFCFPACFFFSMVEFCYILIRFPCPEILLHFQFWVLPFNLIWFLGRICAVLLCLCNYLDQYEKVGSSHLWKWVFIRHMCWFGLKRGSISVPVFLACNGFCDFSNQNAFNYVNN